MMEELENVRLYDEAQIAIDEAFEIKEAKGKQ